MIFDEFKNLHRYSGIPYLSEIEKYVKERDCTQVPDGEHEILGRELFVRVAEYFTGPASEKQFEAHLVYADLQLVVAGREVMDVSLETHPKAVTSYEKAPDIQFFKDTSEISSVTVSSGQFTVFFPGELHKPGCHVNQAPGKVKKLVFKIRMSK